MNWLDWLVVGTYSLGLLGLGYCFKGHKDSEDYYLGGRSMGWFPLALSTMATQLSAISFISAPAFVALKPGGGMQWLTFEFGVPIAMILLMAVLIPPLYKAGIVSAYAFLEARFGSSTRRFISVLFQASRSFGAAVMVYALALILESVLQIEYWQTILLVGVITTIYSFQGGMKAVVWGDTIQMILLVVGIAACSLFALSEVGGFGAVLEATDPERLQALRFDAWGVSGDGFGFWPMMIGGLFLYLSYYGTDQSQIQRALSAKDMPTVRSMLLANGLLRFPITLLYCVMGLIIGALVAQDPSFAAAIPEGEPDKMIPVFIVQYLPHGVMGLLIVGVLAAAMSSLSSAINSLSAASVEDIIVRGRDWPKERVMQYGKWMSLVWGVLCLLLSFAVGGIADTVIEAINKVNSLFYGPILAMFLIAITPITVSALAANLGLALGVALNFSLYVFTPGVFWMWWNATGAIATIAGCLVLAKLLPKAEPALQTSRSEQPQAATPNDTQLDIVTEAASHLGDFWPRKQTYMLLFALAAMIAISASIPFWR